MTQTQHRPRTSTRHGSSAGPPRTPVIDGRRTTRRDSTVLLAMAYGSAIALIVVAIGFNTLLRDGVGSAPDRPLQLEAAGGGPGGHDHSTPDQGSRATIRTQARHLGNLAVDVKATVTVDQPPRALTKADVVMYVDMVQMPQAHALGPIPLAPSQRDGEYHARVDVPMPGDYKVRVVVNKPIPGEATTTVPVFTTY